MYENDGLSTKLTARSAIKKEFLKMYKNSPLSKIKVSDIVAACSISRGTFYFHFPDVCALYHECEQDLINFMEEDLADVNMSIVRRDCDKHIKVFSRHIEHFKKELETLQSFLTGSEEASFRWAWHDAMRRNYEKTMEFTYDISPAIRANLIRFYAGGQVILLSDWLKAGCVEPAEEVAAVTAQVLFRGVFLQVKE